MRKMLRYFREAFGFVLADGLETDLFLLLQVLLKESVGCFQSSEGFSQVIPELRGLPRLILLLFGGIPNSP